MNLNIELFKKIRARIAEIPASYEQSTWVCENLAAPCGTAACLAGEAIICSAPTIEQGIKDLKDADAVDRVPQRAGELLGLGREYYIANEATIFDQYADGWPTPFRQQFRNGERQESAVAYLDWIIENGKLA